MEPEVLVAQPLMKHQREDLSTIVMSPDSICNSDNTSELHNQSYECNNGYFVDTIPTSTHNSDSSKNNTIEGNKRNVFFPSQSSLFENINCNQINNIHNNQTDSMCIIDKRIRSITSPTIISNHQRSSSRSCNYTTIQQDSTKMIHSTSVRNLFSSNKSDHDQLHSSINKFDLKSTHSKSISMSPLKRDVVKKFFLPSNQNGQKYYLMNQQMNESRSSSDLNDQQYKLRSSNIDLHKIIDIIPNHQSSKFISSSINNHHHHHHNKNNEDYQPFIFDRKSSHSTLSLSSTTSSSSKSEMKIHLNQPSIVICRVKSDSHEIINNNNNNTNNDNNNNNRYLLSTNLQRQSVHQSLLNIERSDSSEDQITIKL